MTNIFGCFVIWNDGEGMRHECRSHTLDDEHRCPCGATHPVAERICHALEAEVAEAAAGRASTETIGELYDQIPPGGSIEAHGFTITRWGTGDGWSTRPVPRQRRSSTFGADGADGF